MVLNVDGFEKYHPGGAFVIEHNIGRDISKFFYGGYALTGNTPDPTATVSRTPHSNVAIKIASDLAVARLCRNSTPRMLAKIDEARTNQVNKHTSTFFFKVGAGEFYPMKDTSVDTIPANAANVPDSTVRSFYSDLGTLGKHYTVGSTIEGQHERSAQLRELGMTNKIRRHYTITSAMAPEFLAELTKAVQNAIDDQPVQFNQDVIHP